MTSFQHDALTVGNFWQSACQSRLFNRVKLAIKTSLLRSHILPA